MIPIVSPISAPEMDIIIERLSNITKSFTNISNNQTITLSNYGNMRQSPTLTIKANGTITALVITNTTLGHIITINNLTLSNGDTITISDDMVVDSDDAEIGAIFNAPFYIEENCENTIKFSITGGSTIDFDASWFQPSGTVYTQAFVNNFTLTENKTFLHQTGGTMCPYNRQSIFQNVSYQFSLGRLFYWDDIFDDDDDTTYRIIYQTDEENADEDIMLRTYVLTGVRFESHQLNQSEAQIINENMSGFADRRFKIPRDVADAYFLNAHQFVAGEF